MRLFELGRGKDIRTGEKYPVLYHLCDYTSFSYAIAEDAIRSRSYYVSTTWDQTMNHVVGKPFALFKLVLNGTEILNRYGGFHYDDHATEIGSNRKVSHNEREIGIDTREISPLNEVHTGTVLMFDLFSESGIQWLLYRNSGQKGGFMSQEVAPTKRAIQTLYDHVFRLRKPLWKKEVGIDLSAQEIALLKEAYRISRLELPFTEALERLADKFPIVDHWNKAVDRQTYVRRHMAPKMVEALNEYFAKRKADKVDVKQVRYLIDRCIKMLGLGSNAEAVIMHEIDRSGLLHPLTPAVEWGGILKAAMDGDIDEVLETVQWFAERNKRQRELWDNEPERRYNFIHHGTEFGRGASAHG